MDKDLNKHTHDDMKKTIALDFDGVIHKYGGGWQDGKVYDEPVEGAKEGIQRMLDAGYDVVVFTARVHLDPVKLWIEQKLGFDLQVTNQKPSAFIMFDDRAVRFINWPDAVKYVC